MSAVTGDAVTGSGPAAALLSAELKDPYPLYNELRELDGGVHWVPEMNGFLVTRYEDVRRLGNDFETFSNDYFFQSAAGHHDPSSAVERSFVEVNQKCLIFADPPVHTRLRTVLRQGFTPKALQSWRPMVETVTDELFARFEPGQSVEVMEEIAREVPVAVIAAMLGVPSEDHPRFGAWSFAYASTFDPVVEGPRRREAIATSSELVDYLANLVAERRRNPQNDLTTMLATTRTSDDTVLDDAELLAQLAILLVAGNETTTSLIGAGIAALLEYPQARADFQRDPQAVMTTMIEEMLRFDPPLHATQRKAAKPAQLGGIDIEPGTMIYPVMGAANRDPREYDRPEDFDIRRAANRHLSFFHGVHFCVGAPLARLEAQVVFERLNTSFPDFAAGDTPRVRRSGNFVVRGWDRLPVTL
jgi:cytochrome P450